MRVSSRYGAPFGRADVAPDTLWRAVPVYLRRVLVDRGGYDPGGAYWGFGAPLWCAFARAHLSVAYVRADSREAAKLAIENTQEGPIKWAR